MITYTLGELATQFQLEVLGDPLTAISGLCTLAPGEPGRLSFLANPLYRSGLAGTAAAAVIVGKRDAANLATPGLLARDPYLAFARIARLFDPSASVVPGIHPSASIAPSASLGAGCQVGAQAVVEDAAVIGEGCRIGSGAVVGAGVRLGAGSRVEANAVLCAGVSIGERAHILPGAVIGSRGFGNARLPDGSWEAVPQLGSVVLGDDVEVGANTTIDRGALGNTVIGNGVKLDNQIQIAHNCIIGEHTAIAGSAGIAGSTTIGRRCMIGGAANLNGHISIADDVVILGRAMVTHSLPEKGIYGSGLPAAPAREWRRSIGRIRRLDKLQDRVKHLESLLAVTASPESQDETDA